MLEELRIRGLGVIDEAVLALGPGLTVVTGETGTGKTMVLTGLRLLFGGRADTTQVRAEQASVEGRVDVASEKAVAERVLAAGGELDDGTGLVLRRTVSAGGRSRAYAGGAAVPVAVLGELSERLLAVHGQADQARLVRPVEQRRALDRYAGLELDAYREAYARWRTAVDRFAERTGRAAELRREADLLQHGLGEIDAVAPEPGEDEQLQVLTARLAHADALRSAAQAGHDALVGAEDAGLDPVDVLSVAGTARRVLTAQAGADPELDALTARLTELLELAAELGADLGRYLETVAADPARLAELEQRRAVLGELVRKYADIPAEGIAGVLAWADAARERLAELDVSDEALDRLRAECDAAAAEVAERADVLTTARRGAAERLGAAVTAELAGLALAGAQVVVELAPRTTGQELPGGTGTRLVGPDGADEIEFRFRARSDAPLLPVGRAASGGELSRLMLALEVVLADSDPLPTMVFDEVDAGVGGRAALEVGARLAALAREHQVIVVTHLAQVAAYANRHVVVDRAAAVAAAGERGVHASDVREVIGADRVAELARMLGGTDSATARKHADELLRSVGGR